MTRKTVSKKASNDENEWFVGSGNIFEDLCIPDAEEHDLKAQLAIRLNRAIARLGVSQAETAKRLGISQPNVSQITNYRLQGFSAERMMVLLAKLGHSVNVSVSDAPSEEATISVTSQQSEVVGVSALMGELHESIALAWRSVDSLRAQVEHCSAATRSFAHKVDDSRDELTSTERMTARFRNTARNYQ